MVAAMVLKMIGRFRKVFNRTAIPGRRAQPEGAIIVDGYRGEWLVICGLLAKGIG
jgi:hypothetical protein